MCEEFDALRLNFSPESLHLLNITLGIIMFGVALNLTMDDFRRIVQQPKAAITGLLSQFLLLPLLTLILVWITRPCPGMALGMFLVASCPGGNVSNFMSLMAKGNVALSVSLSAVSTLASMIMTPLNFAFWSQWYPPAAAELEKIAVDPWSILSSIFLILALPLALGMLFVNRFPKAASRINKPIQMLSLVFFGGYVVAALTANWAVFMQYVGVVITIVAAHNAVALTGGYALASVVRLPISDRRTIAIETGIQNSSIALVLIFGPIFEGRGGMAVIAALWGIWHLLSGTALAALWSRRPGPAIG